MAYTSATSTGGERSDESAEVSATTNSDSPGWPSSSGTSQGQDSGHSRNCFIATAAYGSNMHPYVDKLREFRDNYLLTNYFGRKFVDTYYKFSPPIAEVIQNSEFLKAVTRIVLTPFVIFVVYPYTSFFIFIVLMCSVITFRQSKKRKALTT